MPYGRRYHRQTTNAVASAKFPLAVASDVELESASAPSQGVEIFSRSSQVVVRAEPHSLVAHVDLHAKLALFVLIHPHAPRPP